jgi:hypothetical protein
MTFYNMTEMVKHKITKKKSRNEYMHAIFSRKGHEN